MPSDPGCRLLRHTLATLAYRGSKAVRGAPPEFATFRAGPSTRTPAEILAHVGDLLDWGISACDGKHVWQPLSPAAWTDDVARFFAALERFDARLANDAPLGFPVEQLFQGPIADALTHVGQLALLRRLSGAPVRGENYFVAEIAAGRVGAAQSNPVVEFD
jgi:hypothetical protein